MVTHYVNNAEMLEHIKRYKIHIQESKANDLPSPRIPEYLGECILKIATRLSHKHNFINYSYRDDMISDGIENCMQCINSFNPEKSSNPFSYFTQVIYFAFLRRIAKEKKQSYIKGKLIHDIAFDTFEIQDHDDDSEFKNSFAEFMQIHSTFDESYVTNKEKKKKAKLIKEDESLEKFIESDKNE